MGISGLLPLLKSIQRPTELKKFAGETFAVDAYGWLHRGAISCAMELAQGKPTRRFVDSVLNRVRMVQHFGVIPYLVFDGDFLPSKAGTESSRAKRREESRQAGQELLKAGNSKQAFLEFQKAIDITPEMARQVIEELKKLGLPYVVAPYEADAEMVYLERKGLVSGILSEDSDLLVFGAKRLLTKLDMHGQCIEINRRDFCACREIALTDWTDREFRHMAILSGCDYLEGVGNMGLKTAYRMIRKHKTVEKVVRMLQFDGKFKVSENYLAAFRQAELTFLHQRVFCPTKNELVLLTEPTSGLDVDEMLFIGRKIDNDTARAIAVGDVNPITKEPIVLPPSPGKRRRVASIASSGSPFSPAFPKTPNQQPFGKPIDAYFGKRRDSSQRIALGAMDTNCFAVDRQQVAALTDNGLAPRVFPLPRPYVDGGRATLSQDGPRMRRRQTEPLSVLLQLDSPNAAVNTASRRKSSILPRPIQPPASQHGRPQKKQRLCQDDADGDLPARSLERSKYFSASAPTNMPPPPKSDTRAEKFLMSDDSVEEAMMSLPDFDNWDSFASEKPTKTVSVYEDRHATKEDSRLSGGMSELPASEEDVQNDDICVPASDGIEVPASPVGQPCQLAETPSQTTETTPASQLSLSRFSYAPGTRIVYGLPTPDSSFVSVDRPTAKPGVPTPPSTAGRSAVSRASQVSRVSMGSLVEATSPPRRTQRQSLNKKRRSLGAPMPLNPSFVPLPPADLAEVEALNSQQGSEDQIVPDSDGEDEDAPEESNGAVSNKARSTPGRLDLSRFLCT